jgi:hypothetical protein
MVRIRVRMMVGTTSISRMVMLCWVESSWSAGIRALLARVGHRRQRVVHVMLMRSAMRVVRARIPRISIRRMSIRSCIGMASRPVVSVHTWVGRVIRHGSSAWLVLLEKGWVALLRVPTRLS